MYLRSLAESLKALAARLEAKADELPNPDNLEFFINSSIDEALKLLSEKQWDTLANESEASAIASTQLLTAAALLQCRATPEATIVAAQLFYALLLAVKPIDIMMEDDDSEQTT